MDLFFHGHSQWHDGDTPLQKDFFREAMAQFLLEKGITRFSVMGFSMGGKFALAMAENFPTSIDNLILIAPDGIKTGFWYSLATYPTWARGLFRRTVTEPKLFSFLISFIQVLGLLDKGIIKFTQQQMNTRTKRRQVFYSWTVFRLLRFDKKKLLQLLNTHNIPIVVFLGSFDKMIDAAYVTSFMSKANQSTVIVLESGHSHMLTSVAEYIEKGKLPFSFAPANHHST